MFTPQDIVFCLSNNSGDVISVDTNIDLSQPIMFDGRTYHKYPNKIAFREKAQVNNKIEVRLKTKDTDGLLLLIHKPSTLQVSVLHVSCGCGEVAELFCPWYHCNSQ